MMHFFNLEEIEAQGITPLTYLQDSPPAVTTIPGSDSLPQPSNIDNLDELLAQNLVPSSADWNPLAPFNDEEGNPPPSCLLRIKRDMMAIYHEPPPGILVVPDDQNMTVVHALITGAFDTPYEGGFFYFILRFPPDYPIRPPKVRLMTTGGNKVRFNPNLYKCGKVCLSILGTWSGPAWSPAQTLSSVLISIQSLLTDKPYHNEPGFERERVPGDVARYNEIIQHETLRVAVIGMLDNDFAINMPAPLIEAMEKSFLQFFESYETLAQSKNRLTGTTMNDPFGERRGVYQYGQLLHRLRDIYNRLTQKRVEESVSSSSTPDSSD
ncbi:ubiquitin-conjugating enzyme E2 Z-like [Macrosteles quadrilineatus]|uniref:ubiquitin-conjugating enzyme E2 Z-like n=1 Tax=Macrosteles quadrilineatus TaxID=74068 RepID=UPI0023E23F9D|nr:ubiquitin-conjugating enzyme E2 Z-like [Macrosteles quadrilineatus]